MAKLLGVDWGERRVGLALADTSVRVAVTRPALQVRTPADAIQQLAQLVQQEGIERVIVGLPLALAGHDTPQTAVIRAAVVELEKAIAVPVELLDERLTSKLATQQGATDVDSAAAAAVLNDYLDSQ